MKYLRSCLLYTSIYFIKFNNNNIIYSKHTIEYVIVKTENAINRLEENIQQEIRAKATIKLLNVLINSITNLKHTKTINIQK